MFWRASGFGSGFPMCAGVSGRPRRSPCCDFMVLRGCCLRPRVQSKASRVSWPLLLQRLSKRRRWQKAPPLERSAGHHGLQADCVSYAFPSRCSPRWLCKGFSTLPCRRFAATSGRRRDLDLLSLPVAQAIGNIALDQAGTTESQLSGRQLWGGVFKLLRQEPP